jgi:hypothetical protein
VPTPTRWSSRSLECFAPVGAWLSLRLFEPVPPWSDPPTGRGSGPGDGRPGPAGWGRSISGPATPRGTDGGDRVRPQGADAGHHLQTHGFDIETADHPEPFTFPLALSEEDEKEIVDLGNRVMKLKARCLVHPDESLTQSVRRLLAELSRLMEFPAWPIRRVVAPTSRLTVFASHTHPVQSHYRDSGNSEPRNLVGQVAGTKRLSEVTAR